MKICSKKILIFFLLICFVHVLYFQIHSKTKSLRNMRHIYIYQIQRGFNLRKKQKTKTLKYQNDVFENKLTFEFKRNTS